MSYVKYKFKKAISGMSGVGSLRERLLNAYAANLIHLELDELPVEIKEDFERFKDLITYAKSDPSIGSVEAGIKTMDESEIRLMVEKLFYMHDIIDGSIPASLV